MIIQDTLTDGILMGTWEFSVLVLQLLSLKLFKTLRKGAELTFTYTAQRKSGG
jgi:hypothetical protein